MNNSQTKINYKTFEPSIERQMVLVGGYTGILVVILYSFILTVSNATQPVQILAVSLGPMQMINSFGIYYFLRHYNDSIFARYGILFVIIGGVSFTVMLITQFSVNVFAQDLLTRFPEAPRDALRAVSSLGNIIQLSLDIVFDLFVSLGTGFFAIALLKVPRIPVWFGILGIFISFSGLSLNLYTFPYPPAETGYFDPGPFYGLFKLALSIIMLVIVHKSIKQTT